MTLNEFLEKLPPDGWSMACTRIRRRGLCPLACVANRAMRRARFDSGSAVSAGKYLGLRRNTIFRIINSADFRCDRSLRARLLAKCGLTETP